MFLAIIKGLRTGLPVFLYFLSLASRGQNPIVTENALPGNPSSEWDISGAGDLSIQGFATDISVNKGQTVHFKINAGNGNQYSIKIYRLGYYQGRGARLIASLGTFTGTNQPAAITNTALGLVDCGNWSESASWLVPSTAVSGIYLARLTKTIGGGASHIVFIVRDDAATSDILLKTSDATWQAYNNNGGYSLYVGTTAYPNGHAVKVSYNRPFNTRNGGGGGGVAEDWLFNAEYPMIRFLERNGYNITYTTDVDMERDNTPITPSTHKIIISSGHDEYWSLAERTRVESARNAGVHLAFFSGNEVYWKTRWENSIDGNNTPTRTLVCYKEGTLGENVCNAACDPLASVWTGLWRDGCNYPGKLDGCRPENALTGQISWGESSLPIKVPSAFKNYRFWRNTSVANLSNGATATLTDATLGYEWDREQSVYASSYPYGRMTLSSTTESGTGNVHKLSLYRYSSGALVFGAGTVQWAWGLDSAHDRGISIPSIVMQQATVNLFADMGVQPATLMPGLVPASASTDFTPPATVITSPANGATLTPSIPITITGTASEANVLAGVEVSTDGGITWTPATVSGNNWSFNWTPTGLGSITIKSRGFDDSGNMEGTTSSNTIVVTIPGPTCPCTIFGSTTTTAAVQNDAQPIEVGVKFRSSVAGWVTGIRFYKRPGNTGTHTGELYSSTGTQLGQAVFTGETSSGWQQVLFSSPVAITANTTYVAAYFSSAGNYNSTDNYFASAVTNSPLTALADGTDGGNGVYQLNPTPVFPTTLFQKTNYWVDLIFHYETNTWKGTVNTAWENGANWSWGIVPGPNTDVVIKAGSPNNPVINSNVTIRSLTVNSPAQVTVASGFKLDIKFP